MTYGMMVKIETLHPSLKYYVVQKQLIGIFKFIKYNVN